MRNLLLILVAVVGVNALSNATPPADSTIEERSPVVAEVSKPGPQRERLPYEIAWNTAQTSGKFAIFIKMERCGPCEAALPLFTELATSGGYAAVVLDTEKDAELVADVGKSGVAPQVIVYEKRDGEWFQRSVIGNKPNEIKRVMAGENAVAGGLILSTPATARPCSCESCSRDCAANGCSCGKQSGGCGAACELRGSSCASGNCGISSGNRRGFGFRRR